MTLKALKLTPLILDQLARVERAAALYPNADDGTAPLDIEKVTLAELVFEEVQRQQTQQRIHRLPVKARAVPVVVDVALRSKRRPA